MLCVIASVAPLLFEAPAINAQDQPPDLQMLLNLDLFGKAAGGEPAAGESAPDPSSLLDQIRTLDAMGYLGARRGQGEPVAGAPAESNPPSPASQSDTDEETE
jgi:hypothetical protein